MASCSKCSSATSENACGSPPITTPAGGGPQPHALSSVTTTPPGKPATTDTFSYDPTGNTAAGPGEQLTWDAQSRLGSMTKGGRTTSFIYTADGDRLLRKDPTGTTL